MAGCAVTIPLKAQHGESLRGERCRLAITHTVKVVSVCLEEESDEEVHCTLPTGSFGATANISVLHHYFFDKTVRMSLGPLCRTSHKIRAPEEGNQFRM